MSRKIEFIDLEKLIKDAGEVIIEPKEDGHYCEMKVDCGIAIGYSRTGKKTFERKTHLPYGTYYGERRFGTSWAKNLPEEFYDTVVLFDCEIPELGDRPYYDRLKFIELNTKEDGWLFCIEYVIAYKQEIFDFKKKAIENGYEGVVVRLPNDWTFNASRLKKDVTNDYVIMGYTDSDAEKYSKNNWIKNILVGIHKDGKLTQVMRVGSMNEDVRDLLSKNKEANIGRVIEVRGFQLFKSGAMRHPSFVRFRDDKTSEECVL